ncbi:prepilin-type N-terminal cleavage/methylation domain-containing protein [Cerasicoccus frondis]|uniref:prepilin-type N-terminal cleavage/methylation domain-containing protein n=1 Tax=Cerasicoccus frondis TaxID=490090 RepID=UPI0028524C29|nr:prepilin-type N-terminal cleavage/methylation domain-containing protein [Cerasicoccus frondis]
MHRVNQHNSREALAPRGFTLLELLVVVSVLAAVAFIATGAYRGISEDSSDRLVRVEMLEIAKAIQQFKHDTGYYPKTGPFALSTDGGSVVIDNLPAHAGSNDTEKTRWFYSPANFEQLMTTVSPLDSSGHQLATWNPETGRGWRGPYLTGYGEGYVDIRDDINDDPDTAAGDALGDPLLGTTITNVDGIADPFEHSVTANNLLGWSSTVDGDELAKWGRPYLVFGLNGQPFLISMGLDGEYDTEDDVRLDIN